MPSASFSFEKPTLRIADAGRLLDLQPEIRWRDPNGTEQSWRPFADETVPTTVEGLRLESRHEALTFIVEVTEEAGFAVVRSRILPTERATFFLTGLRWESTRREGFPAADNLVRRSLPYDVWGGCSVYPVSQAVPEDKVEYWRTAIFDPTAEDRALTWTVKLPAQWLHRFAIEGECALETIVEAELEPGEPFENDPFALRLCGNAVDCLGGPPSFRVARLAPSAGPAHAAWNSWDHYRLTVTEDDILENLAELKKHAWLRDLVRYVIIDDGWEARTGDWEPNGKFGRGMDWLAGEIRAAGFLPGMWAAPFFAEAGSRIYDEHPEYCVQYEGAPYRPYALVGCGSPWGDRAYLDPTRPEVADHIYQLWRKFYGWGYRYFKTDFLANPWKLNRKSDNPDAPPDRPEPDFSGTLGLHDRALGLHLGHRRCMTAIRSAIGEDSFWLGCGSVWATGAGLMDASRVSADITITWKSLVKCGRNAFLNQHAHGRIWLNDPDFLVVRGRDTGTPEQLADFQTEEINQSKPKYPDAFTLDEARMWAAITALSGGMVVLSDRIKWLNEAGLDILKTIAPRLSGATGRVLAWEGDLPRVVLQESPKGRLLGLFNWNESEQAPASADEAAALPEASWRDLWSGKSHAGSAALRDLRLPPHACALLEAG